MKARFLLLALDLAWKWHTGQGFHHPPPPPLVPHGECMNLHIRPRVNIGKNCFHKTSRWPYWCPKTMKRRPCWCPKPILWELLYTGGLILWHLQLLFVVVVVLTNHNKPRWLTCDPAWRSCGEYITWCRSSRISNHKDNTNLINMAEGYPNSSYNWPNMNWAAADLSKEWERFYQHCEFTFGGPLSKRTEKEKICNLMSFVDHKGREIYLTFDWQTVQVGTGDTEQNVSEKEILERASRR